MEMVLLNNYLYTLAQLKVTTHHKSWMITLSIGKLANTNTPITSNTTGREVDKLLVDFLAVHMEHDESAAGAEGDCHVVPLTNSELIVESVPAYSAIL